jgi:hypothetical protein
MEITEIIAIHMDDTRCADVRALKRRDGGHVRLSTGRPHRAMGRYASAKTGTTVPWESRLELKLGVRLPEVERQSLDLLPSRLAATIYQRQDDGPMRPVGRRRGIRPGGLYYSQKMGRLVGYESDNEKCDFYRAEVSTQVVSYREQPHTIEGMVDGIMRRYTPDREDRFADGRLEIVEVKDEYQADKDPTYSAKLDYFAEVYEHLGWSFRLTTREEITNPASFETVENVQRFRRASFTIAEIATVRSVLGRRVECSLGELLAVFPSEFVALPKLCAMMVARIVVLDIGSKLEPTSIVKPA